MNRATGVTPATWPVMIQRSPGEEKPSGVPPEKTSAAPCRMPFMASVMTMGERPSATMPSPLSSPTAVPTTKASGTA